MRILLILGLFALMEIISVNAQEDNGQINIAIISTTLQDFPSPPATLSIKTSKDAECSYSDKPEFAEPNHFRKKTKNLDGTFSHSSILNISNGVYSYDVLCSAVNASGNSSAKSSVNFRVGMPEEEPPVIVQQQDSAGNEPGLGILWGLLVLIILVGNLLFLTIKVYGRLQSQGRKAKETQEPKLQPSGKKNAPEQDYQKFPAKESPNYTPTVSLGPYRQPLRQGILKKKYHPLEQQKESFLDFNEYLGVLRKKSKGYTMYMLKKMAGRK